MGLCSIMKNNKLWWNAFLCLLAAGIIARVGGAVIFSCNYSGDHAVPCLMSKHIIEGKPIPVFYYGQPYMGSLEPLLGALLYHLPFSPNFNCNLSTALFGMLLLPLIAWWGCKAGGRSAGLMALAVSVIGPPVYLQFMNWSYGGYAAAAFFVAATTLCGLEVIQRERTSPGSASVWLWIGCGALAGLGWWTNPLILVSLGTLFILGVVLLRSRCFQWKLIPALASFFVFGLPFWIWDVVHRGEAIRFILADAANDIPGGLRRFAHGLTHAVTDADAAWVIVLFFVIMAGCLAIALAACRKRGRESTTLYITAAWLILLCALAFFLRKPLRVGPTRYFLPILPAIAVVFGYATAVLNRHVPFKPGWVLVAVVILIQIRFIPTGLQWFNDRHAYYAELESLRPYFNDLGTDVIFADYAGGRKYGHGLNLYYQEAYCVTEIPESERCPHYVLKGERAERVGVLNNKNNLESVMKAAGYSARKTILPNNLPLHDRFAPHAVTGIAALTNGLIIRDVVMQDEDVTSQLTDNNARTVWRNIRQFSNQTLIVTFDAPCDVEKIRFVGENANYPESIHLEIRHPNSEFWEPAGCADDLTSWYWPDYAARPYSGGAFFRQEVYAGASNVQALRIVLNNNQTHYNLIIAELQVFVRSAEIPASLVADDGLDGLIQLLQSNQAHRVYCDRWTANLLNNRGVAENGWQISLEPHIFRKEPHCLTPEIALNEEWTMAVRPENAALCRAVCRAAGLTWNEQFVPGWCVFTVQPNNDADEKPVLLWKGYGPILNISDEAAQVLCSRAETLLAKNDAASAELTLRRVLNAWPDYLPALQQQAAVLNALGRDAEAMSVVKQIGRLSLPEPTVEIRYRNGIVLRGIALEDPVQPAGGALLMRYYWSIPDELDHYGSAVFCHIKDTEGKTVVADDRVVLDDYRRVANPLPEVFVETRSLALPADMPAGSYALYGGLYQSSPPYERLRPRTKQSVRNRSVLLPMELTITAPGK